MFFCKSARGEQVVDTNILPKHLLVGMARSPNTQLSRYGMRQTAPGRTEAFPFKQQQALILVQQSCVCDCHPAPAFPCCAGVPLERQPSRAA